MTGTYLLCVTFLFNLLCIYVTPEDLSNKHDSSLNSHGATSGDKAKGLFNRRRSESTQRKPRPRPETGNAGCGSLKRCARVMETCSAHFPCCNPCALCHCRLFNTICQCWRIGVCAKKN